MSFSRHLVVVCIILVLGACSRAPKVSVDPWPRNNQEAAPGYLLETEHFSILATGDRKMAEQTGVAVEGLFDAYGEVVGLLDLPSTKAKMHLRLYADQLEFKANNTSKPWAEGYYHQGVCHAYVDIPSPSPHHWMMHEVVHQMNREISGFAKEKWLNEGLATYLGSSRFVDGRLVAGEPALSAYPLWWLRRWEFSGDWNTDAKARRVIPLRALITGEGGPSFDNNFNAYYLGYWSITHFLLHYEQGKYANGYRQLLKNGGSIAEFERHIGPVEQVQAQWYAYLLQQVKSNGGHVGEAGK